MRKSVTISVELLDYTPRSFRVLQAAIQAMSHEWQQRMRKPGVTGSFSAFCRSANCYCICLRHRVSYRIVMQCVIFDCLLVTAPVCDRNGPTFSCVLLWIFYRCGRDIRLVDYARAQRPGPARVEPVLGRAVLERVVDFDRQ